METCQSGHEEIVHNESNCPLCTSLEEIQRLQDEMSSLEQEVLDLQEQVNDLSCEIGE